MLGVEACYSQLGADYTQICFEVSFNKRPSSFFSSLVLYFDLVKFKTLTLSFLIYSRYRKSYSNFSALQRMVCFPPQHEPDVTFSLMLTVSICLLVCILSVYLLFQIFSSVLVSQIMTSFLQNPLSFL